MSDKGCYNCKFERPANCGWRCHPPTFNVPQGIDGWEPKETLHTPPLYKMISRAMILGVKDFHVFYDTDVQNWHWDLYSEDPHKWFSIPIPWSYSFWTQNIRNTLTGKLQWPICSYHCSWIFTYYKGSKHMGCQMVFDTNLTIERGLAHALSNYKCDMEDHPPCNTFENDCNGCPNKDYGFKP
jgi:hypothetical protein